MRHSRARKGEATANRIRLTGLTAAFRSLGFLLLLGLAAVLVLTASPRAQDLGIRQYKPKSMLVVAQHPVPRAKYPVIDIHSHHWNLSADRWATVVREMDTLNLRILVNLSGGTGARLRQNLSVVANSPAPTRMVQFADALLERDGALMAGLEVYRRTLLQRKPHLAKVIRDIGRGHELPA